MAPPFAPPPKCQECEKGQGSPTFAKYGIYAASATDLSLPVTGGAITFARNYISGKLSDGQSGIGSVNSYAIRLYYATYLFAAPSTYRKEADIVMPTGWRFQFFENADGVTYCAVGPLRQAPQERRWHLGPDAAAEPGHVPLRDERSSRADDGRRRQHAGLHLRWQRPPAADR